jgi:hypothetical protein
LHLNHYLLTLSNFSSPDRDMDSIGTRLGCGAAGTSRLQEN